MQRDVLLALLLRLLGMIVEMITAYVTLGRMRQHFRSGQLETLLQKRQKGESLSAIR